MKKIATFFILTGSIFMAEGFINFSEAKNLSFFLFLRGSRKFSANTHPFFLIIVLGGKNIRLNLFGSFLKEKSGGLLSALFWCALLLKLTMFRASIQF